MLSTTFIYYLAPMLLSFLISFKSVPLLIHIAHRFGIMDMPNQGHKTHTHPIPYLGGIAIVVPIIITLAAFCVIFSEKKEILSSVFALILSGLVVMIVGLVDDKYNLPAHPRLLIQALVTIMLSVFLSKDYFISQITEHRIIDFCITSLWIMCLINAMNFFDNLDGAVVGVVAISTSALFLMSFLNGQHIVATLTIVLFGAVLGFFFWNKTPAKIYLGDSGALFIGLVLSVNLLKFEPSSSNRWAALFVPIFLVAVPITDFIATLAGRVFRGVSIFQGGKDHLSHRLISCGLSKRQTANSIYAVSLLFSLFAWILNQFSGGIVVVVTILGVFVMLFYVLFSIRVFD